MLSISNLKAVKRKSLSEAKRLFYIASYIKSNNSKKNLIKKRDILKVEKSQYDGFLPTTVVSSPSHHCMTTFYDVEPISPCGKYLLVTNVPFINRIPFCGEVATIVVINIETGLHTSIYETKGWGAQLGANAQWGKDSNTVFCNDVVDEKVVGVKIDISTFEFKYLDGPIYTISSDSNYSYSPNLKLINAMMPGYGVPEKLFSRYRQHERRASSEGIWKTNLVDGKCELFISIDKIIKSISNEEVFEDATYYIFHVKVNKKNDKLFFVLFSLGAKGIIGPTTQLVVYDFIKDSFKIVVTYKEWSKGGHHPNWMPNGEDIIMNLKSLDRKMRFVKICSSSGKKEIIERDKVGGGHPSVDQKLSYLLTDAYVSEGLSDPDGKVPIRLIDLEKNDEIHISKIDTNNLSGPCRIDPHPVWSKNSNYIVWNGIIDGVRRVFVAECSSLYDETL